MHKPDPVETILARLIPSGLSEGGQAEIESMLDDLAGSSGESPGGIIRETSRSYWVIGGGIAAAITAALLVFTMPEAKVAAPVAAAVKSAEAPAGFVLIGESDRIESMTDEGWREDTDGLAMRSLRMNVVEESRILDEETGIVMQVSQPREELLLMPISTF